jgi:hypothetical protein
MPDGSEERAGDSAVGRRRDDGSRTEWLIRSAGPLTAVGGLVLVLAAVLALREVASLVVPVMFGLFIALTAWPMVGALERTGVRHALALAGTIVVVLAVGPSAWRRLPTSASSRTWPGQGSAATSLQRSRCSGSPNGPRRSRSDGSSWF